MAKKYALYTIATDNYILPCRVMIYSFLQNNIWFRTNKHDIVIMTGNDKEHGISEENEKLLLQLYDNIKIERIDVSQYEEIWENFSEHEQPQFNICWLKLELFKDSNYDRKVFLDSDMLIIKDIYEVFSTDSQLAFSEDQCIVLKTMYKTCPYLRTKEYINSGLISVGPKMMNDKLYNTLVPYAKFIKKDNFKTPHSFKGKFPEQDFFNEVFNNFVVLPQFIYNASQHLTKKIVLPQTKIIHYLGANKPWVEMKEKEMGETHTMFKSYLKMLEDNVPYETTEFNNDILCAIINYNNDGGAVKLLNQFGSIMATKIYDTYHKEKGGEIPTNKVHVRYLNNVQYGGALRYAWNEASYGNKKYVLVITSDIVISDESIKEFAKIASDRSFLEGVGSYMFSAEDGAKVYGTTQADGGRGDAIRNQETNGLRDVDETEGWMSIYDMRLLSKVAPLITKSYNIGWAYDQTICKLAKIEGLRLVVDDRVKAFHKKGCGYNPYRAEQQFEAFKVNNWKKLGIKE